jgi:hypothetical protein
MERLRAIAATLPPRREMLMAAAGVAAVVSIVLFQQLRDFYGVPDRGDPLFSMWRMAWVAHQIVADPRHLFDANIFYPQPASLTFSDSMLLPSLLAAPFIWLGAPVAVTYNAFLILSFVVSGVALYVLARGLGFLPHAAWIGALVFALLPFRFEHYSHLELQFLQCMPVALLAAHQLLATGRLRFAALLTATLAAQWYFSMYYGVFLTIYTGVFTGVLAAAWRAGWRRTVLGLTCLLLGVALALPLARVYKTTEADRGRRSVGTVSLFSARPIDYLQPNTRSFWYHDVHVVKREWERELFPNAVPVVLAAIGAWPPVSAARLAVMAAGLVAFDGSLGFNGRWYPVAYRHLGAMQSVRVPARFAVLVGLTLAVLAAAGVDRLVRRLPSSAGRYLLAGCIAAAIAVEAMPRLSLRPIWESPPSLYSSLGPGTGAVLFEFPIHPDPGMFAENLPYMYFSTWHWTRMVNGYSGFSPQTYAELARETAGFPLGDTVQYLRRRGVTHVTLNCALWYDEPCALTMQQLSADARFRLVSATRWQGKPAQLYELSR